MEPLVLGDIQALPRVPLSHLCSATIAPQSSADYEQAVETLAVSIAKYHCAMLQVPQELLVSDSELWRVLEAAPSQRPAVLASVQGGPSNLVSMTYDPKFRRDTLCARLGGAHVLEDGLPAYAEVGRPGCHHLVDIQSPRPLPSDVLPLGRHCTHCLACALSILSASSAIRYFLSHARRHAPCSACNLILLPHALSPHTAQHPAGLSHCPE